MAARAAQFKNQNNDSRSRPLLRASDLEVRSRLRNMNVGVNYKALFKECLSNSLIHSPFASRARLPTAQCAHTIWHLTTAFEEMHFDSRLRQICCQALETSRIKPPLPSTDMKCVCGCAGDGAQKWVLHVNVSFLEFCQISSRPRDWLELC